VFQTLSFRPFVLASATFVIVLCAGPAISQQAAPAPGDAPDAATATGPETDDAAAAEAARIAAVIEGLRQDIAAEAERVAAEEEAARLAAEEAARVAAEEEAARLAAEEAARVAAEEEAARLAAEEAARVAAEEEAARLAAEEAARVAAEEEAARLAAEEAARVAAEEEAARLAAEEAARVAAEEEAARLAAEEAARVAAEEEAARLAAEEAAQVAAEEEAARLAAEEAARVAAEEEAARLAAEEAARVAAEEEAARLAAEEAARVAAEEEAARLAAEEAARLAAEEEAARLAAEEAARIAAEEEAARLAAEEAERIAAIAAATEACVATAGEPSAQVPVSEDAQTALFARLRDARADCMDAVELDPQAGAPLFHLATIAQARGRHREALDLYRQSADAGVGPAHTRLGDYYNFAIGPIRADVERALGHYQDATDLGDPSGTATLAFMYRLGRGVPRDTGEMVRLFRSAADSGYHFAQYQLARVYLDGEGVPGNADDALGIPNARAAVPLFASAARQGNLQAALDLAELYASGADGVDANPPSRFRWTHIAAEAGMPEAIAARAFLLEQGIGIPADPQRAAQEYVRALETGDVRPDEIRMTSGGIPWDRATAIAFQQILRDRGLYTGPLDGIVGRGTLSGAAALGN
jgi:hypothetical protein